MRYLSEFRNPDIAAKLLRRIRELAKQVEKVSFMEVCGTHTMSLHRYGIKSALPENVVMLSGPGCPVCVTPNDYLDKAIEYSKHKDIIIATFGDMVRVPGSRTSLERVRAEGADVRIVYSTLDALKMASLRPEKTIVFLGVGFETTSPTVAASMVKAREQKLTNYAVFCAHKVMPPALHALAVDPDLQIDGFLCPAHVSVVTGLAPYEAFVRNHGIGCVIAGFEPLDMLRGIILLLEQKIRGIPLVQNEYDRVVKSGGNPIIRNLLESVFEPADARWRGIGVIPASGFKIRREYGDMDIESIRPVTIEPAKEPIGCRCGEVLRGKISPAQCSLFGKGCTPENPIGACMVSSEGTCSAYYKYNQPG